MGVAGQLCRGKDLRIERTLSTKTAASIMSIKNPGARGGSMHVPRRRRGATHEKQRKYRADTSVPCPLLKGHRCQAFLPLVQAARCPP